MLSYHGREKIKCFVRSRTLHHPVPVTSFDTWFDPYCAQTVHAFLSWVFSDMHSYAFSHTVKKYGNLTGNCS